MTFPILAEREFSSELSPCGCRARKRVSRFGEILQLGQVAGRKVRPGVHRRNAFAAKLHHSDDAVIPHDRRAQDFLNEFVVAAPQRNALKHGGMAKGWKIVDDVGPPQPRGSRRQRRVAVQRNGARRRAVFRGSTNRSSLPGGTISSTATSSGFRRKMPAMACGHTLQRLRRAAGSACCLQLFEKFFQASCGSCPHQHPLRVARPGSIIVRERARPRPSTSACARNAPRPGRVTEESQLGHRSRER